MLSAMVCIDLMAEIRKIPFWKRERVWREQHEKQVLAKIVDPLNQKIPINELARRTSHTPETTTSEKEHPTMTINEYQSQALRTESHVTADPAPYIRILDGLMGLNGEAGEAIDILKKVLFQGHEFDREHMAKELGDIAWYLAVSADAIGYDLETIFQMNIDKLKSRYPDGFDTEQSQNRAVNDI
jgi:NTP pyrophosphatase (non-canonical NTP hydrolase)